MGVWGCAAQGGDFSASFSANNFVPSAAPRAVIARPVGVKQAKKLKGSSVSVTAGGAGAGVVAGGVSGAASAPPQSGPTARADAVPYTAADDAALEEIGVIVKTQFDRIRESRGSSGRVDLAAVAAEAILASRPPARRRAKDDGLYCICRSPYDGARAYIACDSCSYSLEKLTFFRVVTGPQD